jgi:hypothetical protein
MGLNRFSTVGTSEYTPQHVPLPFEAISAMGEKADKNFAEGKKTEADLGILGAAIKAAKPYEKDRENFIKDYNNRLKTLVDEAKGDYGSKDFQAKANALTSEFKNDSKIQAFAETKQAFDDWQKAKLIGNAKDLDYTYDMDPNDPTGTNFRQRDVLKEGVYSNRMTKWSDWGTAADQAVGQVAASGNQNIGDLNLGNTKIEGGTLYERKGNSWVGVTKDKLEGVVEATVPVYAASEGGQNHLETILQKEFGFGKNAYNVRYMDIDNAAKQAAKKINAGQGTKEDQQTVDMKKQIDQELYNFMYSSNKHQEGVVAHKTLQDQIINDPKPAKGSTEDLNGPAVPLNQVVANPDPTPGKVNSAFKKSNPNSVFSFTDDGKMNYVKVDDVGTRDKVTYKDKNGKVWDPENAPNQWTFYKDEKSFKIDHPNESWKGGYGKDRGVFISSGGYEVSVNNLKPEYKKVSNTETLNKQVKEILSWANLTGQFDKNKSAADNYKELLPKYESSIKNEVLNSKYLPAASKDLKDGFAKMYFPEADINGKITNAGAVSNWLIDGRLVKPFDLVGATFKGFASSENADDVLITTTDGIDHIVNMNDPTLKDNLNRLSTFQKENHNYIMNPVKNTKTKEQENTEKLNAINGIGNIAISNATKNGPITQDLINELSSIINILGKSMQDNQKSLEEKGYHYTGTYTDPKTNILGTSYVNNKTNDIQVVTFDPINDNVTILPIDVFTKTITQKVIGNWNANINNSSKESAVNFENQKAN